MSYYQLDPEPNWFNRLVEVGTVLFYIFVIVWSLNGAPGLH